MKTNQTPAPTQQRPAKIRRVHCVGPKIEQNQKGEQIPTWRTYVADAIGDAVSCIYVCLSHETATGLAAAMARDRELPLVNQAQPALS